MMNQQTQNTLTAEETVMVDVRKPLQVNVISTSRVVDEFMMSDVVVFTTFSWFFLLINLGVLGGSTFVFTLGVLQLCVTPMFFMGARERIKYDKFWGNMNTCFAFFFGAFGGASNVLAGLGIALDPAVSAIPNILIGGLMIVCTAGVKNNPWTFALMWVAAGIGVLALGLAGLGVAAATLSLIGGLGLGVVAVLGTYALVVFMHGYAGITLSLGKPFTK